MKLPVDLGEALNGDWYASDQSPFHFFISGRRDAGVACPERNSPEERGAHRDFAGKESGN